MPFSDEEAIGRVRTDAFYVHEFSNGAGKFFNHVIEDDGHESIEYIPPYPSRNRLKVAVTFIREHGDIKTVSLKTFKEYKRGWEQQGEASFTHFSFQKLIAFLQLLTELDLASINERRVSLANTSTAGIDAETTKKVKSLLLQPDGQKIIDELLKSGMITSGDIVNIGYRKQQLELFDKLRHSTNEVASYAARYSIRSDQPEKAWQHFFEANQWIFGYGLDYRFLGLLQSEAKVADGDLVGRDAAVSDFLMGAREYTVLVEIKRPDTALFSSQRQRAGAWQISSELVGAVSQILEQKASWQVRAETHAFANLARDGHLITQRTVDPKAILIIGSDAAFNEDNDRERSIKYRTFELFRRDSRNIDILTFDELYERAEFIVGQG